MKNKIVYIGLLVASTMFGSCDKYLDIKPVGAVIPTTTSDFRGLLATAYSIFPAHKSYLNLRTDELYLDEYSEDLSAIKDIYLWNDQNPDPTTTPYPYQNFYRSIFYANHILSEIDEKAGNSAENDQIKAEAYAIRAYAHFELLNMYAPKFNAATAATDKGIALSTAVDLEQEFKLATVEEVYNLIFSDLAKAESLVKENVPTSATLRYRFSKSAIFALQSRIHLYRAEWAEAKAYAEQALVINDNLEDLNVSAVLPNEFTSVEMIQALENIGNNMVVRSTYVKPEFIAKYDAAGDLRVEKYFQKSGSRYVSIKGGNDKFNTSFRNGELVLNISEAAVQTDDLTSAKSSLLKLAKNRLTATAFEAYQTKVNGLNKADLLSEIYEERARELALEGLRWFDLKRTTQPQIIHEFGGKDYLLQQNDPRYTIKFPREAIQNNPNL